MEDTIKKIDSSFIVRCMSNKQTNERMFAIESFVFSEESDFLSFDYQDKTHEFEIKVSRSDFKADFKKSKHARIERIIKGEKLVTIPGEERNKTCNIDHIIRAFEVYGDKSRDYYKPTNPFKPWYCSVHYMKTDPVNLPNKFSFIVPEGLVDKSEVPHYAGLYYCFPDGQIKCIKRAKTIHKEKFSRWRKLSLTLFYKTIK